MKQALETMFIRRFINRSDLGGRVEDVLRQYTSAVVHEQRVPHTICQIVSGTEFCAQCERSKAIAFDLSRN